MAEPIRTLVADDEPLARVLLRELVAACPGFEIVGEPATGTEVLRAIEIERPDLILLDIEMPDLSGLEVAQRLRGSPIPFVVFVTAFDRYAIEAFGVQAIDYLVKPIELDRFHACLERVRAAIRRRKLERLAERIVGLTREVDDAAGVGDGDRPSELTFRHKGRWVRIEYGDLVWLEAANQYVRIHTKSRRYLLSSTLGGLAAELDPDRFIRIHRSAVVNLDYVAEVQTARYGAHEVVLSSGDRLRLSRSRRNLLPRILAGAGRI